MDDPLSSLIDALNAFHDALDDFCVGWVNQSVSTIDIPRGALARLSEQRIAVRNLARHADVPPSGQTAEEFATSLLDVTEEACDLCELLNVGPPIEPSGPSDWPSSEVHRVQEASMDRQLAIMDELRNSLRHLENSRIVRDATASAGERVAASTPDKKGNRKRSTAKGEAEYKLISALSAHHQPHNGTCSNTEPIGGNELARKAELFGPNGKESKASASGFFRKHFGGYSQYKWLCARDPAALAMRLGVLNGEARKRGLATFGRHPPNEGGHGDD